MIKNRKRRYNFIARFLYICVLKFIKMTTITINDRTKAGKSFLEYAKNLPFVKINTDNKLEKEVVTEEHYNPKFVAMVKKAQRSKKRTVINPNDIWGSLGLK